MIATGASSMNFQRRETATLIERVRRVLREPRKLLGQREVQLKEPEQLQRNPEVERQIAGNHRRRPEEIGLRTVTARFSLQCEEQKPQTLPRDELGKRIRVIKNKHGPNRQLGRPLKNQKRTKKKIKVRALGFSKGRSYNPSTPDSNESVPK
jgi:hypothetical protein